MARFKNGINGPLSGKIGNVVAASWRGIDYFRSVGESDKPASIGQVNQRMMFAVVMAWLKPILQLISIGYQDVKTAKTPLNAAMSYHLKEAVKGSGPDFEIDFSKAILSRGELLNVFVGPLSAQSGARLSMHWENAASSIYSQDSDKAVFAVYNPGKDRFVTFLQVASRGDRQVVLQLPANFVGEEVHVYHFYVSERQNAVSTSLYLGLIKLV